MAEKQTAWSDAEVAATVASYLEMLQREVSGQPYVKSQFRKTLLPLLSNRSESAVEFKHLRGADETGAPAHQGLPARP